MTGSLFSNRPPQDRLKLSSDLVCWPVHGLNYSLARWWRTQPINTEQRLVGGQEQKTVTSACLVNGLASTGETKEIPRAPLDNIVILR